MHATGHRKRLGLLIYCSCYNTQSIRLTLANALSTVETLSYIDTESRAKLETEDLGQGKPRRGLLLSHTNAPYIENIVQFDGCRGPWLELPQLALSS